MAQWDDILRATLKAAGKAADEIEEIIAKVGKAVDGGTPKVAAETAETAKTVSAAELAKMSAAERKAYNASKAAKDRIAAAASGSNRRAETKLANVKEGEDVINATLGEASKTQLGEKGIAQQFDQYFKKSELAEPSKILKRTMNDPDYVALQKAEDTAVAKAEKEVMDAIESAKADGKPMTEDQSRSLIASKAKAISDEVADSFKAKSQTDIETIKGRAAEGGRELSKKEKEAIARREEVSYRSAKERADAIETQSRSVAEGGNSAIRTRVKTLNELTPEEQRMSGVKAALYKEKAVAQSKGEIAFVTRLEKLAADKKLIPVLDKEGQQIMEEIIIDGEKMTIPRYETPAERNLRLQKPKETSVADEGLKRVLDDDGKQVFEKVTIDGKEVTVPKYTNPDGSPYIHKKVPSVDAINPKDSAAKSISGKDTESSTKLRAQQEANVLKGAKEGAEKSAASRAEELGKLEKTYGRVFDNPAKVEGDAAKNALDNINKRYNQGKITKEEYLELLQGVPKISGKAVTEADMAAIEKKIAENAARRQAEKAAEEAAAAAKAKQPAPATELKGRKWIRDARGNLVLAKK